MRQSVRVLLIGALAWAFTAQARADDFRFGAFERDRRDLSEPVDVAIDTAHHIWVLESLAGRVRVVERGGLEIARWGARGSGAGELLFPLAFAVDDDEVLIADSGNHRVQVFTREGTLLRAWGERGTGPGAFNQPVGLAVHGDLVAVSDRGNHRVQVFTRAGDHVRTIDGGDIPLFRPGGLAFDKLGRLFVLEPDRNRVRVFSVLGEPVATWGEWGPFTGFFDEPTSIRALGDRVIVTDRRNHRVQFIQPDGRNPESWGVHELIPHEGRGKLHYPDALAIAPDGSFGVIVEAIEDRLQIFAAADEEDRGVGAAVRFDKSEQTHFGEYPAADGPLMIAVEPENHFVFVFDLNHEVPAIINRFGERGEKFGLLVRPRGVTIDYAARTIHLVDPVTARISEYRFDHEPGERARYRPGMTTFARAVDLDHLAREVIRPGLRSAIDPAALQRDVHGRWYLTDAANACVHRFSPDFKSHEMIGRFGEADGDESTDLRMPTDLAIRAGDGLIAVADPHRARIVLFDAEGRGLHSIAGEAAHPLLKPMHVAFTHDGLLLVTDSGRDEIRVMTVEGTTLRRIGTRGDDMGELWKPRGVLEDHQGRLIVIDHGNHRAQIFSRDGAWLATFGAGRAYTPAMMPRRPSTVVEDES